MDRFESYFADKIHSWGASSERQEGGEDSENLVSSLGKWVASGIVSSLALGCRKGGGKRNGEEEEVSGGFNEFRFGHVGF